MTLAVNKIIQGDCLEVMKNLPAESINCCISSPPYWALRDYNVDDQLGLESTITEYIDKLCEIYDQVKRVLRKDGTCWVNMGDTYGTSSGAGDRSVYEKQGTSQGSVDFGMAGKPGVASLQKSLCLIPQRFAIEMINRGWILRNIIIWHKTNPMPDSVKDRFTVDFEYVFFFVKNNDTAYWVNKKTGECVGTQPAGTKGKEGVDWDYQDVGVITENSFNVRVRDADTNRFLQGATESEKAGYKKPKRKKVSNWVGSDYWFEKQYENVTGNAHGRGDGVNPKAAVGSGVGWGNKRANQPGSGREKERGSLIKQNPSFSAAVNELVLGRNKRTVWKISTQPFSEAHFATYPEKLIEPMVKAGCPEFVCTKCGRARGKIYQTKDIKRRRKTPTTKPCDERSQSPNDYGGTEIIGFEYSDCGCDADFRPGIVLDPFMGSGTTGLVAAKNRRDWLGIELNAEYIEMAKRRIAVAETGVSIAEQKAGQMAMFGDEN